MKKGVRKVKEGIQVGWLGRALIVLVIIALAIFVIITLSSCTDAQIGKYKALGDTASVECYSGGKQIYKGRSTGKVNSEENSDGYYFIDTVTRVPMEVSGNCIIIYDDKEGGE